ncbi:hypothetical protein BT69DRAFT_1298184 [Atractiella rhizophila]|nr:hypothetical protein BT69DRAFT_1298184 [Atractiella rhizophila]
MVKDVIAGSPNVEAVWMDALWNEEEAKIVLHAIESLMRLDEVTFGGQGWRKCKKDEVENFMQRIGGRIRFFRAFDVEDFASSTSPGLQLSSELKILTLHTHLPHTSILSTPLNLSHLKHPTQLFLNGGEETSNLIAPQFFHTLTNAKAITIIDVRYCVVDWEFTSFAISILTIVMFDHCAENVEMSRASRGNVEKEPLISPKHDQGTESIALVHLITPVTLLHGTPIHLSILPSFLSRLPISIHMLRITFVLPIRFWKLKSKSSYFSLAAIENGVKPDGALILCITLEKQSISVAFGDTKRRASVELERLSRNPFTCTFRSRKPFTCTFHLPDNRSQVLFEPVALYCKEQRRFIPLSEWEESTVPSTGLGTTIQLSLSTTRPTGISLCSITHLPTEILSLIFEFLSLDESEGLIEGTGYLVDFERVSAVCQLWKAVLVPYLSEHVSVKELHARLTAYPNAGHLWTYIAIERSFEDDVSIEMVKDVIAGSPNVEAVWMDALWNEEEAKIVLHAIESLMRLDEVTFGGQGWRKCKKDEVENFMQRIGGRIRFFRAFDVEDFASSTSPGLQLSSELKILTLHTPLPLPSLSLPLTLTYLHLSNLCPLPPSVSGSCLPPLLEHLDITLAPYSPNGKTSILSTPLNLSHLKHPTQLFLNGGEETSNLIAPQFFHTLTNAKAITIIDVRYCVVDWEFTRGVKEEGDTEDGAETVKTTRGCELRVQLFFGGWLEDEICKGRSTLRKFGENGWNTFRTLPSLPTIQSHDCENEPDLDPQRTQRRWSKRCSQCKEHYIPGSTGYTKAVVKTLWIQKTRP